MVNTPESRSESLGSSTDQGHSIVFLDFEHLTLTATLSTQVYMLQFKINSGKNHFKLV